MALGWLLTQPLCANTSCNLCGEYFSGTANDRFSSEPKRIVTGIDPLEIRRLFNCDPDKGLLWWRPRTVDMFADVGGRPCDRPAAKARRWNKRYAGKPALTARNQSGYRQGAVFGRQVSAHRVLWAWVNGSWPDHQIDHINGVRDDNRIENLRDVTQAENARNAAIPHKNKLGVVGVYLRPERSKKYHVSFQRGYLGSCATLEEARKMREKAERENGFHPNHGRRARRDNI